MVCSGEMERGDDEAEDDAWLAIEDGDNNWVLVSLLPFLFFQSLVDSHSPLSCLREVQHVHQPQHLHHPLVQSDILVPLQQERVAASVASVDFDPPRFLLCVKDGDCAAHGRHLDGRDDCWCRACVPGSLMERPRDWARRGAAKARLISRS